MKIRIFCRARGETVYDETLALGPDVFQAMGDMFFRLDGKVWDRVVMERIEDDPVPVPILPSKVQEPGPKVCCDD